MLGVLLGPLYIRRKYSSLIDAIEVNILAGGDNCSRAIVLGPMYVDTTTVIPHQWIEAMNKDLWSRIEVLTNKVRKSIVCGSMIMVVVVLLFIMMFIWIKVMMVMMMMLINYLPTHYYYYILYSWSPITPT